MSWYFAVLRKYAVFEGRARRKEFWYFTLVNTLVIFVLILASYALGWYNPRAAIGTFDGVYSVAILIPSIAVGVRRLHDTGRSGWWLLVGMVPFAGTAALIVFFALDGQPQWNRYGPSPKAPSDLLGDDQTIDPTPEDEEL